MVVFIILELIDVVGYKISRYWIEDRKRKYVFVY